MKDFTYKTTAVALQGRRLVTVSRKGGVWAAVTAAAGDHYLRHGNYPPICGLSVSPSRSAGRLLGRFQVRPPTLQFPARNQGSPLRPSCRGL